MTDFSVKALIGVTDRVSRPLEAMNKRIRSTLAPIERLRKTRMNLSRSLGVDRVARSFGALRGQVSGLLGPLGALGAGLGVAGIVSFTQRYSEAGDEIAKTSKLLGLNVEAYQELRFAAERSGVATGTFTQSMKAFTKRLGEARQGTGALHTFLDKLDPSIRRNVLAADTTEEAFRRLTFAMSKLTDEEDRAALASAAFSRAGLDMVNLMSGGVGEVDRLRQKMRDLGGVMGGEAARDAEAYRDSVTNFQTALSGLTNLIGAKLLPVLTPFLERITASIAKFSASGEAVGGLEATMSRLGDVLDGISLKGIIDGITAFADSVSNVVRFVGGWENALIGLAVVMNGPLIGALVSVAGMVAKIGVLMAANPIGLVAAALAASAYVIYDNWGNIDSWFETKLGRVNKAFEGSLLDGISEIGRQFNPARVFAEGIDGLADYLFGADLAGLADKALRAGEALVMKIVEGVRSAVSTAVAEFTKLGEQMMQGLIDGLDAKIQQVQQKIEQIGADVAGWFARQLGIQSPSRVFMGFGQNIAEGLALGIGQGGMRVAGSVAAMSAAAMSPMAGPAVAGPLGMSGGGGLSGSAAVEIVVRAEPGTEVRRTETRSTGGIRANVGRVDSDLTGPF